MALTLIASAKAERTAAATTLTLTVPVGVTASHFGLMTVTTTDSVAVTCTVPSWTNRVDNPTGQGNHSVHVLTRVGGHTAGDVITVTLSAAKNFMIVGTWFDAQGRDVESVGTTQTRGGTAGTAVTFPGVAVSGLRDVLLVGTDRTAGSPVVNSWTPSTPSTDGYTLSTDRAALALGTTVAHFTQGSAGTTATYVETLSASSGNASGTQVVLTAPTGDTTAPTVPGSVTATANSPSQVTIDWAASTDAVGVVSYRIRRGGVDLTGATALPGTTFADTTVSPSSIYSYTVSAVDAAGNRSAESAVASVTTPALPDTTPPTVPGSVSATANNATQITVAWSPSTDDVGVASYRIRRGGVDLPGATAVTGTSFADTSVAASTSYSYTVSAVDAAGNRSAESSTASATTPAAAPSGATASVIWQSEASATAFSIGVILDSGTTVQAIASLTSDLASPIVGTITSRPASGWSNSRITGLTAGTTYFVGIRVDGQLIATGRGTYKTLVTGLVASKVITSSCNVTGSTHVVFTRIKSENPDFFAHQGDIHYADLAVYDDAAWRTAFSSSLRSSTIKPMLSTVSMRYGPDNHDGPGSNTLSGTAPWSAAVTANVRELTGEVYAASTGFYKTFVHAGIRYIELDVWSFRSASTDVQSATKTMLGAAQKAWLLNLLQTSTEPAIVVFGHFPHYSNLVTGGRWGDFNNERNEIGNAITALPTAQRNKIVFVAGDSHSINADDGANAMWGRPSLNASPLNQSGGLASGNWNIANIDVPDTRGYFSRLTWTPGVGIVTMKWEAVQDDGTVMATFSRSFTTDTTAPTVPTGVTATPNSSTQVTVSWLASTDNIAVASYRVRRNGADLPGALAVTGTSFVDSTVVAATAYTYTVSAVDAEGNRSAESAVASVTTPVPPPPPPPETTPPAPTPDPTAPPVETRAMQVTVFRREYERVGQVPDYVSCSVTWDYLDVGPGQLVVGEDDPVAPYLLSCDDQVIPVVVDISGTRWSGRVAKATLEREGPPGSGQVTATLVDDWAWLQAMIASQNGSNPGLTGMAQSDIRGGPAASVAADFINAAATRLGAPVWASKPPVDLSLQVVVGARMDRLSDLLKAPLKDAGVTMAAQIWLPGDVQPPGVPVPLTGPTVVFTPQLLPDKPWLQWTDSMTNIGRMAFETDQPKAYRAIVGLSGSDAARVYDEVVNSDARTALGAFAFPEIYTDASDATLGAQSQAAGLHAVAEVGGMAAAALTVADGAPWVFGKDYVVGDMATIVVGGSSWRQRVTKVTAEDSRENGLVFVPVIGDQSPDATGETMMVQALARVAEGLRALQAGR